MHVINIVPRAHLELTKDQHYHISLYQELVHKDEYLQFYQRMLAEGKFVIMDNGAAEGVNPTCEELIPIYDLLKPSEIVLPDMVGAKEETITRSSEAYQRLVEEGYHEKMQFMAVPQGKTFSEWLSCLREMLAQKHISTIGVSKFVTKLYQEELGAEANVRLECVDAILTAAKNLEIEPPQIHLLGCYHTPFEIREIEQKFPGVVRSTDSAIAYVFTRNNMHVDDDQRPDQKEINFSGNDIAENQLELLKDNMYRYTQLCMGK